MAYLGKGLDSLTTANITVDRMTGNGSTATMTITLANGVNSVNDISAFVSGIMQRPGTDYTLSGSTLSFTTAPANGLEVVAISHGDSVLDNVADATTITESFKDVSITDANIGGMSASKLTGALSGSGANLTTLNATTLTGALPAISGANLTNLNAANLTGALPAIDGSAITGVTGYTISASDPAINTNPSGGLGSVWSNSTSGEVYTCTDATAGANVWTNIGAGEGNFIPFTPGSFGGQGGGTAYGYHSGGYYPNVTAIQGKYSYSSDGNSTSVHSLVSAAYAGVGFSSDTHGYTTGADIAPQAGRQQRVEKHNFASNTQSQVGGNADLALYPLQSATATNSSTHGYMLGGANGVNSPGGTGAIMKFNMSTEAAMTLVGDAYNAGGATTLQYGAGHASYTHGYRSGGHGPPQTKEMEKWSFATDSDSVFVGNMVRGIDTGNMGGSSTTHGYIMGGHGPSHTEYDKFSFSSDSDSTTVGVLFHGETYASSTSSTTHCYMAGGGHPQINTIQKGSFASDIDMTDVGDILSARAYIWGFQD